MSTEIKPGQVWAWHPDAGTGGGQFEIKAIDRDMASYGYLPDPNVLPYRAPQSLIREKATIVTDADATPAPLDPSQKARVEIADWDDFQEFDVVVQTPGIDGGPFVVERDQPAPEPEVEWKPGDVADIEVDGGHTYRAIRNDGDRWDAENAWTYGNSEVTDVRPLVVIDPAAVDVDALAEAVHKHWGTAGRPGQMAQLAAVAALAHLGIEVTR